MPRHTKHSETSIEQRESLFIATLPEARERQALLRSVLLRQKLQARVVNDLVELYEYIRFCGGLTEAGCCAYIQTYASRLKLPVRTTKDRIRILRSLGIVEQRARYNQRGRTASAHWVNWSRVQELARSTEPVPTRTTQTASAVRAGFQVGEGKFPEPVRASFVGVSASLARGEGESRPTSMFLSNSLVPPSSSVKSSGFPALDHRLQGSPETREEEKGFNFAEPGTEQLPADTAGTARDWQAVASSLARLGIFKIDDAIRDARQNGLTSQYVMQLIEHFDAHPGAWGVGMLWTKMRRDRPGQPLTWPKPAAAYFEWKRQKDAQQAATRQAERARQAELERQKLQRERERLQQERHAERAGWNSHLAGLTKAAASELLQSHSAAAFLVPLLQRTGLDSPTIQDALREVLEANQTLNLKQVEAVP